MKNFLLAYLLLFVTLIGCKDDPAPALAPEAEDFLNEVLDIMERNSINRKTIDWQAFKMLVLEKATGAKTIAGTYPAIEEALKMLGDNHSFYVKANGGTISARTVPCNAQSVVRPATPPNIGYVKVSAYSGASDDAAGLAFATEIQDQIKDQDNTELTGWIVDLRSNLGGNMWPMLAGIGPILGEGTAGYFIDPDGNASSWGFVNGGAVSEGFVVTQLPNPYALIAPQPKVAVLLDAGVASSGEVIAISFIGRNNTKSFGASTCGTTTGNRGFTLSDNSTLYLSTVYLADRNKNLFGIPVEPDFTSSNQNVVQDALEWLEN